AVLRNVASLSKGAEMTVLGVDGGSYVYALESTERVEVATLTQEKIKEIVGPTDYAALTIITCGGRFNYDAGEYYERDILRARLVSEKTGNESAAATTPEEDAPSKPQGLAKGASAVIVSNVNLRPEASTAGDPLQVLNAGDEVTITGESVDAEGYTWWPVTTAEGTAGWLVADFIKPAN
ncbi:MAG: SH3 domain-containing protein, partial [Edaphobacter sp.]